MENTTTLCQPTKRGNFPVARWQSRISKSIPGDQYLWSEVNHSLRTWSPPHYKSKSTTVQENSSGRRRGNKCSSRFSEGPFSTDLTKGICMKFPWVWSSTARHPPFYSQRHRQPSYAISLSTRPTITANFKPAGIIASRCASKRDDQRRK